MYLNPLIGATILEVRGMSLGSDAVVIRTDKATLIVLHEPDCCESVTLDDVDVDPSELIGATIRNVDMPSSEDYPAPTGPYGEHESYTWTFIRIITDRADCSMRWLGESNGYYGESPGVHVEGPDFPADADILGALRDAESARGYMMWAPA